MTDKIITFERVRTEVGPDIADRLINWRRGEGSLYIPRNVTREHPIAAALGFERAKRLVELEDGGYWIDDIPQLSKAEHVAAIAERRRQGATITELAAEFGMNTRNVTRLCADVEAPDRGSQA